MAFAEWAGIAAAYDRSFGALCAGTIDELLDELEGPDAAVPAPPENPGRLLDAGTGTGAVALAAAARGWQVDAVDAEPSMVEFAAARARELPDAARLRFAAAALPAIPYPDAGFDAVAANFCINHVDRPRDCLRELGRVLRPGGRLAATVWPWESTPTGRLWAAIQEETGARPPAGDRLPLDSDFARTEEGLAGLLAESGFAEVRARRVGFVFRVSAEDLWAGVEAGIAVIGYAYAAADEAARLAMRAAYDARTPALTGGDGLLAFEMSAVLASGVWKPDVSPSAGD